MSIINLQPQNEANNLLVGIANNTKREFNGRNLFDRSQMQLGKNFSNVSGDLTSVSNVAVSGYIPVNKLIYPKLAFYARKSVTDYDAPVRSLFFDKYFNSISSSYVTFTNGECDIPDNAAYFRFSFNTQDERFYDAVVAYATRPVGLLDMNRVSNKPKPTDGNLININSDICWGVYVQWKNNAYSEVVSQRYDAGAACTCLIPVKPNTDYIVSFAITKEIQTSYLGMVYEYDRDRNFLRVVNTAPFYTSSADCYFVVLNYLGDYIDFRNKPFYLYEREIFSNIIGEIIAENKDCICYNTRNKYAKSAIGTYRIIGLYENNAAVQLVLNGALAFSTTGLYGKYHYININNINFPNLQGLPIVNYVLFFNTSDSASIIKCLVLFNNNQIYTSTDSTFTAFEECDVWDVTGNHNYHIAEDDKDPTGQRYRAWLPSDVASRQNAFMWHNGPVHIEGAGGQYGAGVVFGNYTNAHGNVPCPSALFYTKDGKNIYKQYEFGVYQYKYKLAGDSAEKTSKNYGYGDTLDVSQFTGSITSVTLKKRWNILPTETTPNPTDIFEYGSAINVSSISGGVATLADASGLSVGDTIILQGTATGDYAKILNNDASATEGGQVVFTVTAISGNNVTLADAVGNPRNNLMCRHIHGVNIFGQGLCFYTGEEYPESWFIYIAPKFNTTAASVVNDNSWTNTVKRLNSGANAHQRSLGVYLRNDGKMVAIADSPYPFDNRVELADGTYLQGTNFGVHIFDVKDINDASMSISKIPNLNAGYSLYYIGGVLFFSDYHGKTYYSKDEGDTWIYICQDNTAKNILIGFDKLHKRYVFNTMNENQFVIEFK